jgi:hypothetical protein
VPGVGPASVTYTVDNNGAGPTLGSGGWIDNVYMFVASAGEHVYDAAHLIHSSHSTPPSTCIVPLALNEYFCSYGRDLIWMWCVRVCHTVEGVLALYASYTVTFDLLVNVTAGVYTLVVRVNDDPDVRTWESYFLDNTYDVGYWTAQVPPLPCTGYKCMGERLTFYVICNPSLMLLITKAG